MMKLRRLKIEALEACRLRGHQMQRFHNFDKETARALCLQCGRYVQVETNPAPNSIDIGGDALALHCASSITPNIW